MQREVLVLRGFLQYLLGTLSNELSQHTESHKRKVVEWETRCASARADRALKRLVEYSSSSLAPFDRLVRELTALMAQQATQV